MSEPLRFEFTSRGDRVQGTLWSEAGERPRPLVLVTPALGASQRAPEVEALCRALAECGLAAAAIDLPLQGERASPKLSPRLAACASRAARSAADERLWAAFVRQAACDLGAAVDALAARGGVATGSLACLAFEPGAEAAAGFSARDPRVASLQRVPRDRPPAELARRLRESLGAGA